jgi:glycosyltransferase involved in cell wall biosynthesis
MKIAQVNVYFHPLMVGGAEWYVYNLSKELVKRGHEVHVYTVDTYKGRKVLPRDEVVDGINVHRMPLWLDISYRVKIWKGLQKSLTNGGFDIIHTYDYGQLHSYVSAKAGKKIGCPVALTVFDVHSMIPRSLGKRFLISLFDKYVARFTLKNATKILLRAPNLVDSLTRMGASPGKIVITPSGVEDVALEPADRSAFTQKYGILGKPIVLYLGRLNPMKGPQHLIMASHSILAKHPETAFIFVGPDQNNYRNKLTQLGRNLGVLDHLVFTGPIYDFETKMQAFAASDVFVLPSGYEGTSQAIFGAMAQARPIVATNRGGIPFQIGHEQEGLLVEYANERALASAILRLLDDNEFAIGLGLKAKEKVKSFTYSILANQIENIYFDMAKNKERRNG